jgi:hypothetical protein
MDSLLPLFAAPSAAASAFDVVGRAASAATRPFAQVLAALSPNSDAAADSDNAEAAELPSELVERLQELLAAGGIEPGQTATVSYDPFTGRVEVDHASPLAGDVAARIEADAELVEQLQSLAEKTPGEGSLELLIELA